MDAFAMSHNRQEDQGFTKICSNTLKNVNGIFSIRGIYPLTVQHAEIPRVWLQGVGNAVNNQFVELVTDSRAVVAGIKVTKKGKSVEIKIKNKTILLAESSGKMNVVISELDFRPIGLNIFGNSTFLSIAGSRYSDCTFSDIGGAAFGLG